MAITEVEGLEVVVDVGELEVVVEVEELAVAPPGSGESSPSSSSLSQKPRSSTFFITESGRIYRYWHRRTSR